MIPELSRDPNSVFDFLITGRIAELSLYRRRVFVNHNETEPFLVDFVDRFYRRPTKRKYAFGSCANSEGPDQTARLSLAANRIIGLLKTV